MSFLHKNSKINETNNDVIFSVFLKFLLPFCFQAPIFYGIICWNRSETKRKMDYLRYWKEYSVLQKVHPTSLRTLIHAFSE